MNREIAPFGLLRKIESMTILEFLQKAQYSRLTVGERWMTYRHGGFTVCERKKGVNNTVIIGEKLTEEQAVKLLIEGEELYHDILTQPE